MLCAGVLYGGLPADALLKVFKFACISANACPLLGNVCSELVSVKCSQISWIFAVSWLFRLLQLRLGRQEGPETPAATSCDCP